MPLISVIMGVYNCKNINLLRNSVNSIIKQTITDWEFIICNDGSSDGTLNELYKLAKLDKRIRIISYKENKGLAYALNKCISVSKGIYIARQDDDDTSVENRFEIQLNAFKNNPKVSIIGSNAVVVDDQGPWGVYKTIPAPQKNDFLWNSPFAHPTVMMTKESLIKSGGYRVSKETRRCEDYDLFMRMYANGFVGINIQKNLYNYRIINDNHKYRPMRYRIDEAVVRAKGYKKLRLFPKGYIYVLKPVIIGMIPQFIFKKIRDKQY